MSNDKKKEGPDVGDMLAVPIGLALLLAPAGAMLGWAVNHPLGGTLAAGGVGWIMGVLGVVMALIDPE